MSEGTPPMTTPSQAVAEALRPCPFCGGGDIRFDRHVGAGRRPHHRGEDVWSMCCYNCGATFPNRYRKELLVECWNRRASLASAGEEKLKRDRPAQNPGGMECQTCGAIFIGEEWHHQCAVCAAPAPRDLEGVDRLRTWDTLQNAATLLELHNYPAVAEAVRQVAKRSEEREAKIEEMRKALEPFAKEAERFDEIPGVYLCHDNVEIWQKPDACYAITVGDLRRARSLSGDTPTNKG